MEIDTDSSQKLMSPEELRINLLNINNHFCKYIESLSEDFDKSPEYMNKSINCTKQIIDEFSKFHKQFNILHDKALNNRTKQNQKDSSPKEIIVDNKIVKHLSNVIKNNLNNLKVKNDEYNKALVNYENEFNKKSNSGKSEKKP